MRVAKFEGDVQGNELPGVVVESDMIVAFKRSLDWYMNMQEWRIWIILRQRRLQ